MANDNVVALTHAVGVSQLETKRRWLKPDSWFRWLTASAGLLLVVLIGAMAFEAYEASKPSILAFGWGFLTGTNWDPVRDDFGALPFIFGTLASSLLALAISVPISFGVAIYLAEWAPAWLREPLGFLVELLAAVASVIYGLWGIFALAPFLREVLEPGLAKTLGFLPFFQGAHQGFGMLAGGIILAIMITPTIASVSREVLKAVPQV